MCRCIKISKLSTLKELIPPARRKLAYLEHMRILMARPLLPIGKSVYDMDNEELEKFKKEVEKWKNTK